MSSAVPIFGPLPATALSAGLQTDYGIWLPPNGRVTYVCNNAAIMDYQPLAQRFLPTLDAGLKECRSGAGDTVVLMPGHSESFTAAAMGSLVAGTRIIGIGNGSARPKLTLSGASGTFAVAVADVVIRNIQFDLGGANNVTKGINVTAADFVLDNCDITVSSGASLDAAIAIELGTGSARARITNNVIRGTTAVTDGIKIVAAVDGIAILNNEMIFPATEINGQIHITAAATNLKIGYNQMANTVASSTACIVVDNVAATGMFYYNNYSTLNDGTVTAQGAIFGAGALIRSFQCFSCDEPKKSGTLTPAAGT